MHSYNTKRPDQMTKYNLDFLEKKLGPFHKEYNYPTKPVSGFNLIYVEKKTKTELDDVISKIKDEMTPGYIWGYVEDTNAIYVTRAFGENKLFNYNPMSFKKTDYVKSKLKILSKLNSENINKLFDQKAVFDSFYRKLWDLRLDLAKEIRDRNGISDNKALMAAQHIMDRIIFTYFICEKDLVTLNGKITLSNKTLFSSISKMPDPWRCLKNLFFEQFAKKDSKPLFLGKNAQITTPYLNGGLFRPKKFGKISEENLIIGYSRKDWQTLFKPLDEYTWIIEDELPSDERDEGNLTPEIIGHIYEKFVITIDTLDELKLDELKISKKGDLLRGNKKIGAYYTPEPITDYITRNTITSKLYDELGLIKNPEFNEFIQKADSETLQKVLNVLSKITICDPACGSGAFLIKAGEILLEYKIKVLKKIKQNQISSYDLKKEVIINNLYGVDIQEGAVEICKLRLWLWLISSSKELKVEPLPNIEYNFLVGNSLIGWANENLEQNVLIQPDNMVLAILDALKLRFESKTIDKIKEKIEKTDMKSYAEAMALLKDLYSYSTEDEAEKLKNIIESIRKPIYEKINGVFYTYIKSKGVNFSFDEYKDHKPFHWNFDFNQILNKGGFDVCLGNPPYIFARNKKFSENLKNYYNTFYNLQTYQLNTYGLFTERSYNLLSFNGDLGFIIPNNCLTIDTFSIFREFILNNTSNLKITNIYDKVFDDANVDNCVLIFRKSKPNIISLSEMRESKLEKVGEFKYNDFEKNDNIINIPLLRNKETYDILQKIETNSAKLKEISKVSTGLKAYQIGKGVPKQDKEVKEKRIFHSMNKLGSDYYPYLQGKDVARYNLNWSGEYLKYGDHLAEPRKSVPFEGKRILVRQIPSKPPYCINATFVDDKILHDINSMVIFNINKNYGYKFILGVINSKLISYWFFNKFGKLQRKLFPQFKVKELKDFPIINPDDSKKLLTESVDRIIALNYKINNIDSIDANTNNKINKEIAKISENIDFMIYKMYGLSENEIKIVEDSMDN